MILAGGKKRIEILSQHFPPAGRLAEAAAKAHPRSDVGWDDILDAVACAVTARVGRNGLRSFPPVPKYDARRYRMAIA